jgi:MinD-like ATPase involved in chromosome partitioning or flagellar assembly
MAKIITLHSFRRGTGKSSLIASIAVLLANSGHRVGVIDTDLLSPGLHIFFGLERHRLAHTLNDYLWGRCAIEQTCQNVTPRQSSARLGQVFLLPSSTAAGDIARVLREGYDVHHLNRGLHRLIDTLGLDTLLLDTHAGLDEETLLSIVIADTVALTLRHDQQDYRGTAVMVEVLRRLEMPRTLLIANQTPPIIAESLIQQRLEQSYGCEVLAMLPHSHELMTIASGGIFALRYPNHPLTSALQRAALRLVEDV